MKKVVIFPPESLEQVARTFIFLRKIEELYPEAEINIIAKKEIIFPYRVTSERYRCFEIPEELNSKLGVYKFIYNLNEVFNIDTTIDLNSSPLSGIMSAALRSEKRLGWDRGAKKIIYNQRVDDHFDKDERSYLKFLGIEQRDNVEHIGTYLNQTNENTDEAVEPFICLFPTSFVDREMGESEEPIMGKFYRDLLEELKEYRLLIFYDAEVPTDVQNYPHVKILPYDTNVARMALFRSKIVLTEFEWVANYMAIEGRRSCYISENDQYQSPVFYKQKPSFLKISKDEPEYFWDDERGKKDIVNVSHFVDFVTELFESGEEEETEESESE